MIVVDEFGKEYEATYPKRARGLVKHGRARFIGENQICLTCPPNMETEDNEMSENVKTNTTASAAPQSAPIPPIPQKDNPVTVKYILEQMEKIQSQTEYLFRAIEAVKSDSDGGVGVGNIVEEREKTNRQLLAFYERMYEDIKRERVQEQKESILCTAIQSLAEGITPLESATALRDVVALALNDLNETE